MSQLLTDLDAFYVAGDPVVIATISVFLFVIGAVVASFSCLVAYRLKTIRDDQSIISAISFPASHCDGCGRKLSLVELIPVFGWIIARGRCNTCGARIPVRYPATEAALGAVVALMPFLAGGLSLALPAIFLCCLGFMIAVIDWENGMIPEELTWILLFAGLILSPYELDVTYRVTGAAIGAGLAWMMITVPGWIRGVDTRAWGDVAMVAGAGAWLGCWVVSWTCVLAAAIHMVISVINSRVHLRDDAERETDGIEVDPVWTPLGPAMMAALVVTAVALPIMTVY